MFPKRRTIPKTIPWYGFFSKAENTIAATLPPGFTTRRISVSAFAGLGKSIRAIRLITASKESGSNSRFSAFITRVSTFVRPSLWAASAATFSMLAELSAASTFPVSPMRRAAMSVDSPVPAATSNTRLPGWILATSSIISVTAQAFAAAPRAQRSTNQRSL